jgi:hypothetical protein
LGTTSILSSGTPSEEQKSLEAPLTAITLSALRREKVRGRWTALQRPEEWWTEWQVTAEGRPAPLAKRTAASERGEYMSVPCTTEKPPERSCLRSSRKRRGERER